MSTPLTDFQTQMRAAQTLLKVHHILETPNGPVRVDEHMDEIRTLLMAAADEEILLIKSEIFLGAIRDLAGIQASDLRRESLNMLLRQAIVAACSAMDVYYPALLRTHLPTVITIKQRNAWPPEKKAAGFIKDLLLKPEQVLRIMYDPEPVRVFSELLFEQIKDQTLSNLNGVLASLQLLGLEDPVKQLSDHLQMKPDLIASQFDKLVGRRNDIVHRADRSKHYPDGPMQAINYAAAESFVNFAGSIVQASDALVEAQLTLLNLPDETATATIELVNG
jgi:hypothetical protein